MLTTIRTLLRRPVALPRPPADVGTWLVVCLLVVALFPRVFFMGEVFFERDIAIVWVSQVEAFVRSLHEGSWPVWDPTQGFGRPLLGNPSYQVFYPFTWLNLVIRPWRSYVLYVVAHFLIGGLGVARLGRHMGLSPLAYRVAACVWMASGPMLSVANINTHLGGAVWLPWIVLAARRTQAGPRSRNTIELGVLTAAQVLAGSPDFCVLTALVVLADALRGLGTPTQWRKNASPVGRLVLAYVVCFGLSAAQWLPSLELALDGGRRSLPAETRTFWSLHPVALGQLVLPLSFTDLPRWAGPEAAARFFELWSPLLQSGYLGFGAAVAFAWSLGAARHPDRNFLLFVLLGSVGGALGRHFFVYDVVASLVPPVAMLRHPVKALIVASFAWAIMAGIGLDAWRAADRPARQRTLVVFTILAALCAAFVLAPRLWSQADGGIAVWGLALKHNAWNAIRATSLALATAAISFRRTRARATLAAISVLVIGDLVVNNGPLNATARTDRLDEPPAILGYVNRRPPSRVYVWDYVLRVSGRGRPAQGMLALFLDVPGGDSELARIWALQQYLYPPAGGRWRLLGSYEPDLLGMDPKWTEEMNVLLRAVEETPAYLRLLQIGGVERVVALHAEHPGLQPRGSIPGIFHRPIYVFEVPDTLPRVYVPANVYGAEGDDVFRALLSPGFQPGRDVVIAESLPDLTWGPTRGKARIVEELPDRVRIEAELDARGAVVLLDGAGRGWRATVDSRPARVRRANGVFRAVEVPAGRHHVEFVYRPASVMWGLGLSVVTALALLALSVRARARP